MKIDWLKTVAICCAIVLAGFFVGNMHKTGKKYDQPPGLHVFLDGERIRSSKQLSNIKVEMNINA